MIDDDRGLRLPVEAEPHHHDRRDADDRQRRDQIADRQQAAAQERRRGRSAIADEEAGAAAERIADEHRLEEGLHEIGARASAANWRCARRSRSGGGSSTNGTPKPRTTHFPEDQKQRRRAPDRIEPALGDGAACAQPAGRQPGRRSRSHAGDARQQADASAGRACRAPQSGKHAAAISAALRRRPAASSAAACSAAHHGRTHAMALARSTRSTSADDGDQRAPPDRAATSAAQIWIGLAVIGAGEQPRAEAGHRAGRQFADDGADQADRRPRPSSRRTGTAPTPASAASRRSAPRLAL